MELVTNLSFIEAAAQQLVSSKCCIYNLSSLFIEVAKFPNFKCENIQVINEKTTEKFNIIFISAKQNTTQPCIVYLHGLSSYCFEGQYLLQYLENNYSLCIYDLRSHGKNKNPLVTYGVREADDLYYVIKKIVPKLSRELYLWGRSMGASTILNFLNIYGNEEQIKQAVKYAILDSPFCSFQQIAKETTSNNLKIPHFICSPLVSVALTRIFQKYQVDLRIINFSNLQNVKYPAIFIYSEKDEVVNCQHSAQIIERYGGKSTVITESFLHNDQRPADVVQKIFKQIKKKRHVASKSNLNSKSTNERKGLSISLISSKNLAEDKQNCLPFSVKRFEENAKKQLSPKNVNKFKENYFPVPGQMISFSIKREMLKDRPKIRTSQKVIEQQRSKSKNKGKGKHLLLTNKRYI